MSMHFIGGQERPQKNFRGVWGEAWRRINTLLNLYLNIEFFENFFTS